MSQGNWGGGGQGGGYGGPPQGGWGPPPGFGAFINQVGVTAGLAFSLGLISFLRRERLWWVAAMPTLVGGLVFLPFVFIGFLNIGGVALRPMLQAPDLSVGILLALNGVFFLAWLLPRASARLAREREAEGNREEDARVNVKAVRVIGIVTLVVGIAFILIHSFDLF